MIKRFPSATTKSIDRMRSGPGGNGRHAPKDTKTLDTSISYFGKDNPARCDTKPVTKTNACGSRVIFPCV